jgi:hypothetical protein
MAQQVLRDEMKKRRLDRPRPADNAPKALESLVLSSRHLGSESSTAEGEGDESDQPREYTWKTLLCVCNDMEEATPIRMALWKAGIESWIEGSNHRVSRNMLDPRILVAADQLEQARMILASPIPQEIVEESKIEVPEFEFPVCPKCGAEDPVLEGADPANSWLCEECSYQWTDAAPE